MAKCFKDIITFIEDNLKNSIEYSRLSQIANCSEYTLVKVFPIIFGISIVDYIRRRRLTEAAQELLSGKHSILDIAMEYQYNSPDSFTRAFKAFHGILPSKVQISKSRLSVYLPMKIEVKHSDHQTLKMKIEKKEEMHLFGITRHYPSVEEGLKKIGDFWKQIDTSIEKMHRYSNHAIGGLIGLVERSMHGNGIDYTICVSCENNTDRLKGFRKVTIRPSRWIVFKVDTEASEDIQSITYRIYNDFLPQSDYTINDQYEIELYDDNGISLEEIWIPIL